MFCNKCNNTLTIREEFIEKDGNKKGIFYYCCNKECNHERNPVPISEYQVFYKNYRNIENNKSSSSSNDSHLNEYKSHDITLPSKLSKCPRCNKRNDNKYERKISTSGTIYINKICSHCYHNW